MRRRSPPPNTIKVGGNTVHIRKKAQDRGVFGRSHSREGWIEYSPDLSSTIEKSTILHECIHQIMDVYFLEHNVPKRNREPLVLGLEVSLFAFLRDNPKFVRYLCQ